MDNPTLSDCLTVAKEQDAIAKEANKAVSKQRALAKHLIDAGMCSDAQRKTAAALFPPRGRGASKK